MTALEAMRLNYRRDVQMQRDPDALAFWRAYETCALGETVDQRRRMVTLIEQLMPRDSWRALTYFQAGVQKYGEPFLIAEQIKRAMRAHYAEACPNGPADPGFLARSAEFWAEYEDVNRLWLPDDPVYSLSKAGVTLSTTLSTWQLLVGAAAQLRILESFVGGEATVSTVVRIAGVQRSVAGTGATPTNTCTINKFNTRSPGAASSAYGGDGNTTVNWGTTPEALSGSPLVMHAFNAFGGTDRWVSAPGEEIYQVNGEYSSSRSQSGTPVVSQHLIWEEL